MATPLASVERTEANLRALVVEDDAGVRQRFLHF